MTQSEYRRHLVFQWCDQNMESETAEAMMEMLPNITWTDVATKADVDAMGTSLRGEMAELRSELCGEMADLRGELRGEMAELRGELRGDMGELRGEVKRDIAQGTRTIVFSMVASQATLVGLVLAATRLG